VAPSITPRLIELEHLAGASVPRFATPQLGCGLASRTSSGAEDRDGCAPSSSHTARSTRMALLSRSKLAPSCRSVPPDPEFHRALVGMRPLVRAGLKLEIDFANRAVSLWTP
jgi:hypothetical protein